MSKSKQRIWLIVMLLIYLIIALAGFAVAYYIKLTFFQPKPTAAPQTVSKITPVPTQPGWKTYTNSNYKITFSYPPGDTITTSSIGFNVTSLTLTQAHGYLDFKIMLLPNSLAQAVGYDFNDYYGMSDNASKVIKNPLSQDTSTDTVTKIDNRSVNGLQAVDYQSIASDAQPGAQPTIGTLIQSGSNVILISTGKSNKENLEQILSSFKSL